MNIKIILLITSVFAGFSICQNSDKRFSLLVGLDYTTTAQIFLNPNSSDIILRNQAFEIADLFSPIADFRYSFSDELLFGLSSEYISKSAKGFNQTIVEGSQVRQIEVEDGVKFIPIEFSVYYLMPFSSDKFIFTMGGGLGYYFAEHTRVLGDTEIENTKNNSSIGLLVSVGMEYLIIDNLGIRLDLKFRDPENKISYRYTDSTATYRGRLLQIPQSTYNSKLNLNGISFVLGVAFHFKKIKLSFLILRLLYKLSNLLMKNNLIYLTGFMASGKSTIGPILANTVGWNFYDLDKVIEDETNKSVRSIFEEFGENYFRDIETKTLTRLSELQNHIISLGGGTVANNNNLEIIKSSGYLIYLESSPEETYKRLRFKRDRPAFLFDGDEEPTKSEFLEKINSLLDKRAKFYNQADFKINTDNCMVGKTVDKLAAIIQKEFYDKPDKR